MNNDSVQSVLYKALKFHRNHLLDLDSSFRLNVCHTADSCAGVSRHELSVCLQAAEGVYRDAGAAGGDD